MVMRQQGEEEEEGEGGEEPLRRRRRRLPPVVWWGHTGREELEQYLDCFLRLAHRLMTLHN